MWTEEKLKEAAEELMAEMYRRDLIFKEYDIRIHQSEQ